MKYDVMDSLRLKAVVDAVKDRPLPGIEPLRLEQEAEIAKLRRNRGAARTALFSGAGFDATAPRRLGMENTRRALEHIRFKPYLSNTIPLATPYGIFATPAGMLRDSHVEPWNNWAKFSYSSDRDAGYDKVAVNFWFAWQNRSDYLAVINCSTDLLTAGVIVATADTGWFEPGMSWMELVASLTVFVGQDTINWQTNQRIQMGTATAQGGWSPIGGAGGIGSDDIFGTYRLSCGNILVPAQEFVVFQVSCSADWWIDSGGSITVDFDFDGGGYELLCRSLQVELLTPPAGPIENIVFP